MLLAGPFVIANNSVNAESVQSLEKQRQELETKSKTKFLNKNPRK